MLPFLLAAAGGYIIGNSLNSKQYADGGLVDDLPAEEIIKIIKSVDFKSFDPKDINEAKYITETYNPFDKTFKGIIKIRPAIITIGKIKEGYLIRIGKNTGWIGGLSFTAAEYSFVIKSLNVKDFEEGLKKVVEQNIVTLYSEYGTGNVEGLYFRGKEKDAEKFAISKGYKKIPIEGGYTKSGFSYYYYNENMPSWKEKRLLYVHRFPEYVIDELGIKDYGAPKNS